MENKNSIIIVTIIIGILLASIIIFKESDNEKKELKEDLLNINYDIDGNETSLKKYETSNPVVAMYVKDYGSIVIELYPEIAPNTVNNFISLVKNKFYDKNTFHRLVKDFVLQGGDPEGTGTGGPGYKIKGEFTANGFENNFKHEKGVVSMARSQENDSAGSQFFIVLEDASTLDGSYATFGKVIDGWSNIDNIIENETIKNEETGQLSNNLTIKKAVIDLKGKKYKEPEKIEE